MKCCLEIGWVSISGNMATNICQGQILLIMLRSSRLAINSCSGCSSRSSKVVLRNIRNMLLNLLSRNIRMSIIWTSIILCFFYLNIHHLISKKIANRTVNRIVMLNKKQIANRVATLNRRQIMMISWLLVIANRTVSSIRHQVLIGPEISVGILTDIKWISIMIRNRKQMLTKKVSLSTILISQTNLTLLIIHPITSTKSIPQIKTIITRSKITTKTNSLRKT